MSFRINKENYEKFKDKYKGQYKKENNKIYLPLEWKLLLEYGSKSQKVKWDKFRRKYILSLIKKFCNEEDICYFDFIGSKSIYSDIDINIKSLNFPDIMKKIENEHYKFFDTSFEDMFDINIYGSIPDDKVFQYLKQLVDEIIPNDNIMIETYCFEIKEIEFI